MFDILEADIVILQETKIQQKDLRDDMVLLRGWDCYFSLPRFKKGMCTVYVAVVIRSLLQGTLELQSTHGTQCVLRYERKKVSQASFALQVHRPLSGTFQRLSKSVVIRPLNN